MTEAVEVCGFNRLNGGCRGKHRGSQSYPIRGKQVPGHRQKCLGYAQKVLNPPFVVVRLLQDRSIPQAEGPDHQLWSASH